jgi:DNA-binding CsgD family transcriptional regulator
MSMLDSRAGGIALVGPAGVGRTRLLREVINQWRVGGGAADWVVATAAAGAIPFVAVSHLFATELGQSGDPIALAARLAEEFGDVPRVVGIDDAHLLDDGSAALLHQLAVRGVLIPVASVRAGVPVSDAVTAMWKDNGRWISVPPLDPDAVDELLDHAVPGPLDPISRKRLRRLTSGNPLLLRELLDDALDTGTLREWYGVYRWHGVAKGSPRLTELVAARTRAVPQAPGVLEIVACGEPLSLAILERLVGPEAVEAAERSGMAVAERSGDRTIVRLSHPLYGEVLRAGMPISRARRIFGQLAAALLAGPMRRRDDPLLAGMWELGSGVVSHPEFLLAAAHGAVARFDLDLAERLSRAARSLGKSADELLARVLADRGRGRQAPPDGGDQRSWFLLIDGHCTAALEEAERVLNQSDATPLGTVWAAMSGAAAAGLLCQPARATQLAERGRAVADANAGEVPWGPAQVGFGLAWAMWANGALADARAMIEAGHRTAVDSDANDMAAVWSAFRGLVAKAQGHLRAADAALREAIAMTTELDSCRILRPCLAELAGVAALTGDPATAREVLARADNLARPASRLHDAWVERNRAWVLAALGTVAEAIETARRAAKLARDSEQPAFEAIALYDVARLGAGSLVCARLDALSAEFPDGFAPVLAGAATALAADDGSMLERAGAVLADRGHLLQAAELHSAAASALQRNGSLARARTAAGQAAAILTAECQGARTPLLDRNGPTAALTQREREIARLATNLSSRKIADHLGLSVHTVNNTLARAYSKLGVSNRTELIALLGITELPSNG